MEPQRKDPNVTLAAEIFNNAPASSQGASPVDARTCSTPEGATGRRGAPQPAQVSHSHPAQQQPPTVLAPSGAVLTNENLRDQAPRIPSARETLGEVNVGGERSMNDGHGRRSSGSRPTSPSAPPPLTSHKAGHSGQLRKQAQFTKRFRVKVYKRVFVIEPNAMLVNAWRLEENPHCSSPSLLQRQMPQLVIYRSKDCILELTIAERARMEAIAEAQMEKKRQQAQAKAKATVSASGRTQKFASALGKSKSFWTKPAHTDPMRDEYGKLSHTTQCDAILGIQHLRDIRFLVLVLESEPVCIFDNDGVSSPGPTVAFPIDHTNLGKRRRTVYTITRVQLLPFSRRSAETDLQLTPIAGQPSIWQHLAGGGVGDEGGTGVAGPNVGIATVSGDTGGADDALGVPSSASFMTGSTSPTAFAQAASSAVDGARNWINKAWMGGGAGGDTSGNGSTPQSSKTYAGEINIHDPYYPTGSTDNGYPSPSNDMVIPISSATSVSPTSSVSPSSSFTYGAQPAPQDESAKSKKLRQQSARRMLRAEAHKYGGSRSSKKGNQPGSMSSVHGRRYHGHQSEGQSGEDSSSESEWIRKYMGNIERMLQLGFYYSFDMDITHNLQKKNVTSVVDLPQSPPCLTSAISAGSISPLVDVADPFFIWNHHLLQPLRDSKIDMRWMIPIIQGSVSSFTLAVGVSAHVVQLILICRRSCNRAGTRYNARGIDDQGHVANFCESEQIVITDQRADVFSLVQIRGSVPLFWEQTGLTANTSITRSCELTEKAFGRHQASMQALYGQVYYMNLLSTSKSAESKLTRALEMQSTLHMRQTGEKVNLLNWDFHNETKTFGFENALYRHVVQKLLPQQLSHIGHFHTSHRTQMGVLRTNCLDCLDRTNAFQWYVAWAWIQQLLASRGMSDALGQCHRQSICVASDRPSGLSEFIAWRSIGTKGVDLTRTVINSSMTGVNAAQSHVAHWATSPSGSSVYLSGSIGGKPIQQRDFVLSGGDGGRSDGGHRSGGSGYRNGGSRGGVYGSSTSSGGDPLESEIATIDLMKDLVSKMWADQGDNISMAYTGTGSVLSGMIKQQGKASLATNVDHMLRTLGRFYQNNFEDAARQQCYDLLLGRHRWAKSHPFTYSRFNHRQRLCPNRHLNETLQGGSIHHSGAVTPTAGFMVNGTRGGREEGGDELIGVKRLPRSATTPNVQSLGIEDDEDEDDDDDSEEDGEDDSSSEDDSNCEDDDEGSDVSSITSGVDARDEDYEVLFTSQARGGSNNRQLEAISILDNHQQDTLGRRKSRSESRKKGDVSEARVMADPEVPVFSGERRKQQDVLKVVHSDNGEVPLGRSPPQNISTSASTYQPEQPRGPPAPPPRRKMTVWVGTWNVAGVRVDVCLDSWLLKDDGREQPDVYVVCIQELVELFSLRVLINQSDKDRQQALETFVERSLGKRYLRVSSTSLVGLCSLVYVRTGLKDELTDLDVSVVKLGLKGNTGNKGAICVRMQLGLTSFCFANLHLVSGTTKCEERLQQLRTVMDQAFQSVRAHHVFRDHDVIIVAGDMNFRVDKLDADAILSTIRNSGVNEVLRYDQFLRCQERQIPPCDELCEAKVKFHPTYKLKKGTQLYDSSRAPAWCDRVLYTGNFVRNGHNTMEGPRLKCTSYEKCDLLSSDHRPVMATFDVLWDPSFEHPIGSSLTVGDLRNAHLYPHASVYVAPASKLADSHHHSHSAHERYNLEQSNPPQRRVSPLPRQAPPPPPHPHGATPPTALDKKPAAKERPTPPPPPQRSTSSQPPPPATPRLTHTKPAPSQPPQSVSFVDILHDTPSASNMPIPRVPQKLHPITKNTAPPQPNARETVSVTVSRSAYDPMAAAIPVGSRPPAPPPASATVYLTPLYHTQNATHSFLTNGDAGGRCVPHSTPGEQSAHFGAQPVVAKHMGVVSSNAENSHAKKKEDQCDLIQLNDNLLD
eukprot:GHVN01056810.1.p1 GENE.GHVN01056810.1~~GHVN01056810.1.p1  ORF type:complete len:1948 (-),score=268.81 GHVN01056810.1:549-6392(-)